MEEAEGRGDIRNERRDIGVEKPGLNQAEKRKVMVREQVRNKVGFVATGPNIYKTKR